MRALRAGAYCRKSQDEIGKDAADKSITRQLARAREYAAGKGWTFDETCVFSDDGVSGAEFNQKRRPGFYRMLAALSPRPPFDVLIVSEQSRLGRDTIRTLAVILQIQDAGVRIFSYLDDREITLEQDIDEVAQFMPAWADSAERKKASQRVRDQKRAKAAQGRLADGRVLGYRTVGDPKARRREIDPEQAKLVVRIFEMAAAGKGLLRIMKALNAEGVVNPTGQSRNGSQKARKFWSTTGIREVLRRDIYRGQIVYGKTRWERRGGSKRKVRTPPSEWITVDAPKLRIVPESLWTAVQDRLASVSPVYRRRHGSTPSRSVLESKYLLSGFLTCGSCGGNLIISKKTGQRGRPVVMYICATRRTRGETACPSKHGVPERELTEAVLAQLKHVFCNPVALGQLVMHEMEQRRAAPEALDAERRELTQRIATLTQELERATELVFAGTAPATLVQAMHGKEAERADLQAKLEHLNGLAIEAEDFDLSAFLGEMKALMDDLRGTLEADPTAGRQTLRKLLVGAITVTPTADGAGFTFAGTSSFQDYDYVVGAATTDFRTGARSDPRRGHEPPEEPATCGPDRAPCPEVVPPG